MHNLPVVLVTGGAQRIGRAISLYLAGHGWRVAVHSRGSAAAVAAAEETVRGIEHHVMATAKASAGATARAGAGAGAGAGAAPVTAATAATAALVAGTTRAAAFAADLADEGACNALVPAVAATFGRIDAVVNNASVFEHDDVGSFCMASMQAHWCVNTAAPILLARALHAHTHDGAGGCVVNLLDQKLWNPNPDHLSYTLSKAALASATTLLAQALAPRLRVCGVAPGVTLPSGPMDGAEFAASHAMTPLGRSSTPDDIARAVHFLLASPAITGTTLLVDGGQHLQPQPRDVMFLARAALNPKEGP